MPARRIVVGVDGSDGARVALSWCLDIAPLLDAEIVVVHAFEHPVELVPPTGLPLAQYDDAWRARMGRELDDVWCAPVRAAGVAYRAGIVDGNPAEALIRAAEAERADLLVVGRRGRGSFAELLLGSVPHHLAHHATTPLVIVPNTPT